MCLPEPADRLNVAITLHLPGAPSFVTRMSGSRRPATVAEVLRLTFRHPFVTRSTMARIRLHGIALWLRRVPIRARPPDAADRSSSSLGRTVAGSMAVRSKERW
jgi:DUF1365 family protein